jgi:hypothetical protein
MGQRYTGTATSLASGSAVQTPGLSQQVAARQENQNQAQVGPRITVVDVGGVAASDLAAMAASDSGWSMADVGDDGVDQVPGEQAAFDDILREPGDAEAVRAENMKMLEDKIKRS